MSAAAIVALGGLAALIVGLVLYERTRGGARELGLEAVLVAAATAGRIAFAAIPSAFTWNSPHCWQIESHK